MIKTENELLDKFASRLYDEMTNSSRKKGEDTRYIDLYVKENKDSFSYIPSNGSHLVKVADLIVKQIKQIRSLGSITNRMLKIADLGCGDGLFLIFLQQLLQAKDVTSSVHGVEMNKQLAPIMSKYDITYTTFNKLTKSYFADKNVVYLYCPLRDSEPMLKLLLNVCKLCLPGTIVIFSNACVRHEQLLKNGFIASDDYKLVFYKTV